MKISTIAEEWQDSLSTINKESVESALNYIVKLCERVNKDYLDYRDLTGAEKGYDPYDHRIYLLSAMEKMGFPNDRYVHTEYHIDVENPKFSAELVIKADMDNSNRAYDGSAAILRDGRIVIVIRLHIDNVIMHTWGRGTSNESFIGNLKISLRRVLYHELRHITQKISNQNALDDESNDDEPYLGRLSEIDAEAAALAHLYLGLSPEDSEEVKTFTQLMNLLDKGRMHDSQFKNVQHAGQGHRLMQRFVVFVKAAKNS